ncbi:SDR family oxidoreductase [Acuticoccus sp. M5D2P5]|uniref:SDR family oxidoreductase n=1 Tax=Acuticoccus kalidii TaxID=2910977 RepID=UPI001F296B9B|nr:SDR family oxidoreductase [Acuticoccus kalidii]MCF3933688.1 SDR family oxidoreductase [Acuticoccus kalidii]
MSKVMIVTGGSRGIGAATVLRAVRAGYRVAFSYASDEAAAARMVADAEEAGGQAIAVRGDMGTEEGVLALFAASDEAFGPPDVLVNNAGITGRIVRVADMTFDEVRRLMDVNVTGVLIASREAIRRMSTAMGGEGGSIIHLSSRASLLGGGGEWAHYGASKGAIDTLTIGLAREVGGEGIRVNAIRPGLIDTEIHARAGAPDRLERLRSGVPLGRAGTAAEVAEAVIWLASDAASYVSGSFIDVSGGR